MAYIYFRIFGYVCTIILHTCNLLYTAYIRYADSKTTVVTPDLQFFGSMQHRYLTSWIVVLQIFYALYSLICDILILKNSKKQDYQLPKLVRHTREILFAAIVWPCSWLVFTFFWSIYKYDRSLIFPEFLDEVLSSFSNHIMHTAIVPIVLWEAVCRPRKAPRSHTRNLAQLTLHILVYTCVLFFTYYETGKWLYPIFDINYGTIYFPLVFAYAGVQVYLFYFLQWPINRFIHGDTEYKNVEKKVQ